jgi:hypothetical protein
LIDYISFYASLKNFSPLWRSTSPLLVKGCKIWSYARHSGRLGAGRNLYRATHAVVLDLGFSGLIRRVTFIQSPLTTHEGMWRINSNPDLHGFYQENVNILHLFVNMLYSGASLIRTPLIRMLHYPDDTFGNKLYENLSNMIHLSGHFVYPDDFAGNQSVRINKARLYSESFKSQFGHI